MEHIVSYKVFEFKKIAFLGLTLLLFSSKTKAQDDTWGEQEDWADKKGSSSIFFVGINAGALFVNGNTAHIYNGSSDITPFGINYILNLQHNKTTFDTYFQHPYSLSELPQESSYNTAFDIGLHAGIKLGAGNTVYIDINSTRLRYEQFFTIAIDDPNNQSPEPTFQQFPIIGEEERLNVNLGTQIGLWNNESMGIYWSVFGNFNSIKLKRNYIVINGREYEIQHTSAFQTNNKPGGVGFGGGSGVGFKVNLSERVLVDLTYNLYYIKSKMNDNIQPFGVHNGILFRLIWN